MQPYKSKRQITPEVLGRYEVIDVPPELASLNPELLADLHDIMLSVGVKDRAKPHVRRLSVPGPKEISITAAPDPASPKMLIFGPGGQTSEGAYGIKLKNATGFFIWDKRVSVEDVQHLIAYVDQELAKEKLIDPVTHERNKCLPYPDSPAPKYSVESAFAVPGTVLPILPGMPDAETVRQRFDRPNDVAVIEDPFGMRALCHKRDLESISKWHEVAKAVLAEQGITKREDVVGLSNERIKELRKIIKSRLG